MAETGTGAKFGGGYLRFVQSEPRFLAFGFVLTFFSSFGQTFFISLFGESFRSEFGLSHTQYGLTYSVATLCSGLSIIYLGRKIDVVDLRTFTLLLGIGLLTACVLLANSVHIAMLAVAFFLLRLCGQGLLGHTAMTTMSRYFGRERGKALSVAGLGFPTGEAFLPLVFVAAIAQIGWRNSWYAVAAAIALGLIPMVVVLLKGHTKRHADHLRVIAVERREHIASQPDSDVTAQRGGAGQDAVANAVGRAGVDGDVGIPSVVQQWTLSEVLRDSRFFLLLPAVIAPGFIVTGIFFHQGHLLATKMWTPTWFASCFIAFAAAQILTSIVAGPLVDRFGATKLMTAFLYPLMGSLIAIALGTAPATAILFLGLFGVTAGLSGTIVGAMWAEVYGTQNLGAIRALATAIMVFGTAGSPVLFGKLIDGGTSIDTIAWYGCGYTAVAVVLAAFAMRDSVTATTPRR